MATLAEIYDWFMTAKRPTQDQFWQSWGSFWNKGETIPQSAISNLSSTLNAKAEKSQFDGHLIDENAHANAFLFKEDKINKGVANGYPPLNEDIKIPAEFIDFPSPYVPLIVYSGQFLHFKVEPNTINELEEGDIIKGIVENHLIEGFYLGGDIALLSSFEIITSQELT